ncbi:type II toxin-antitoxin system Phd/YefM family antitoxin [Vibrio jasicida]|uniref:type II toxin-antitoxin system Phd/YefM family antitoxin n=1 Tax=Vibrio jasicida TaxID=766224 RepID=UPI0005EF0171|nr:type II toxin-antitoxin system Phd/YefM family antitoxin [Vibrio jasicida]
MKTVTPILADLTVGISELKKNPMAIIDESEGQPVAVLNRNKPAFYAVPPDVYERMLDALEDIELARLADAAEEEETIKVNLNDL